MIILPIEVNTLPFYNQNITKEGYMKTYLKISAASLLTFTSLTAFSAPRNEPISPIEVPEITNPEKVELGKMLFFEPRLSRSGFFSCNSCHNLATGGADNLVVSVGHKWQFGGINAPTVLNSSLNFVQFWDGRAEDLQDQAGGPIMNPIEMASTHEAAVEVLESIPQYQELFKNIYNVDKITMTEVTDAIAAFEDTLVTPNDRFDQWLRGDDNALSEDEKQGYALFKSKGCISCHNTTGLGGSSFQKFGLAKAYDKDTETLGRFNVTGKEEDKYVFKTPLLRNIELTAPYFHDGSTWSLEEAVKIMGDYQLGQGVSDEEAKKIADFLRSLTGEQPQIIYPILPPSTEKTPKPNLD